jgi:nucleoid DNA-binding protein
MAKTKTRKKTVKKATAKAADKPRTKNQIFGELALNADLTKKQVGALFEGMTDMIKKDLSRRGPGAFTVPGLIKLRVVRKPATKARKGTNPFTGEEMVFKAKPARNVVKATALKGLKDMVN